MTWVGRDVCRSALPSCDAGRRGDWYVARTAVYIYIRRKGRTPEASGGAGSDVVDCEVSLASYDVACPLVCFPGPSLADGTWHGIGGSPST